VNLNLSNPSAGSAIGATQSAAQLVIADINPTPTDIILNNSTVNENVSAAATVGGFSSVSPISGDNFTFNLVPGDGDQDNALFMVDGNQLKIKISPNYEAKSSYSIRVRTTQADGRSFEKIFIIGVNDQPESAEISGVATLGVKEGTGVNSNGQIVASGVLTVIDPDAGQSKFQTDVLSAAGNLGSLIINQSGVYAYTLSSSLPAVQALNAGQTKVDTFTVKSFDGSASKDISVTISGATAGFNAVAAGDPTSNGATLWTRTFDASDTSARKGLSQSLTLTIATDAAFANPVFSSFGSTSGVDHDSTIKINATGLSAGASYYYRFQTATGETSPVGFFKTAPLATSDVAVRFAHSGDADGNWRPYLSSQDFPSQKFDFFIFNGDTIYETASKDSPAAPTTPATEANPTAANLQALLAGYQRKYLENLLPASGGSYPGLQSLYSSQGVYVSLDNHELGNKEIINGGAPLSLRAQNFNGSTNPSDDVNATGTFINDSASFDTLLQAFLDYQPIRTPDTIVAPSDLRSHGEMMLYGSQQWGQNAVMINLDDRSFRDVRLNKLVGSSRVDDTGSRADNPLRTMLGATQLAWLKEQLLAAKAANTTWKFINISDPIDQIGAIGSGDDSGKSWIGGYRAERNEILKFIADNSITNVVFMACDDHQARINEVLYSPSGDLANQSSYVTVPGVISVVDGPLGAGGPDAVTDHSFANSNALAEALAAKQVAAGVDPIGLEKSYSGLSDIWREGDSSAASSPKPVDFYSADTFNYSVLDVSPEGILTVTIRGINSFAANSTPSPNAGNQPRDLLRFSIDGVNDVPSDLVFANGIHSLPEDAITTPSIKLADITIVDDTLGTNVLSLSGADASLFELVGQSLYLKAGTSLNYESGHVSYDVNVSVADLSVLGSSPVSKPYSLQVANVNEAPNSLSLSSLRFNENIAANSIVASLSATDPDQPATPQSFTYSLASGYADNLSFYVSGQGLYIATSPDFERKSFYDVRLLVADQGGLSFQRDIRLSVNDLPDTQTYAVSQSSTSILEGQSVNFGLITTNVPTSTPIYWAISGSGITPADFADGLLTGSGMVGADGRFSLIRTASSDAIADSDENFLVTFYSDAAHTTTLATSTNVQIKEPNVGTPTDGADVIIGTGAAETISGVPNGSTAFGSNSIDKLIGGGGNDLFVLGSSSHRFYDSDGSKGLAIITDFTIGQDRIQLKGAIGDYMLSSGRYNAISGTFVSVASNGDPLGFLQGLRPTGVNPVNLADLNQFTFV
jgi:VCBS repeat-containing protein